MKKENKYDRYMRKHKKEIAEQIQLFGRAVKTFKQVRKEAEEMGETFGAKVNK